MTFFTTYVLYPIIAKTIYQKHSEELSKLKSIKKKIENAELLTMEESQKIRSLHKTLEVERDSLRQQLQNHVDMTNSNKRSHESTVESKESEIKRLKEKIEKLQHQEKEKYSPMNYIDEIMQSESIDKFINFYEAFIINESKISQKYKNRIPQNNIEIDNYDTLHSAMINDSEFIIFLNRYELGKIVQYNSNDNPPIIDLNKEFCTPLYREIKKRQLAV